MDATFLKVLGEAARWNVRVTLVESSDAIFEYATSSGEGIYSAPRNEGAILRRSYGEEHILWSQDDTSGPNPACGLLHEMAHVVMGGNPSQHGESLESGAMLALEHEAGKRLRIPRWGDFMVIEGTFWVDLRTKDRRLALEKAYRHAKELGVLRDGRPTYKRPPPQDRSSRMFLRLRTLG